jgi:hypothetical protein
MSIPPLSLSAEAGRLSLTSLKVALSSASRSQHAGVPPFPAFVIITVAVPEEGSRDAIARTRPLPALQRRNERYALANTRPSVTNICMSRNARGRMRGDRQRANGTPPFGRPSGRRGCHALAQQSSLAPACGCISARMRSTASSVTFTLAPDDDYFFDSTRIAMRP